jgi:hypothetical protein
VTWRQGTKANTDNPEAAMTGCFLAIRLRPASRHITRAADRSFPACWLPAEARQGDIIYQRKRSGCRQEGNSASCPGNRG